MLRIPFSVSLDNAPTLDRMVVRMSRLFPDFRKCLRIARLLFELKELPSFILCLHAADIPVGIVGMRLLGADAVDALMALPICAKRMIHGHSIMADDVAFPCSDGLCAEIKGSHDNKCRNDEKRGSINAENSSFSFAFESQLVHPPNLTPIVYSAKNGKNSNLFAKIKLWKKTTCVCCFLPEPYYAD